LQEKEAKLNFRRKEMLYLEHPVALNVCLDQNSLFWLVNNLGFGSCPLKNEPI